MYPLVEFIQFLFLRVLWSIQDFQFVGLRGRLLVPAFVDIRLSLTASPGNETQSHPPLNVTNCSYTLTFWWHETHYISIVHSKRLMYELLPGPPRHLFGCQCAAPRLGVRVLTILCRYSFPSKVFCWTPFPIYVTWYISASFHKLD